jgi:hypothetical protein
VCAKLRKNERETCGMRRRRGMRTSEKETRRKRNAKARGNNFAEEAFCLTG